MAVCGGVTPLLEIAFGVAPYTEPGGGQWVDTVAAEQVRRVEVIRGKRPERDDYDVGMLRAEVLNLDDRWNPENASSPYYPHIKEDAQVRLRGTVGATTRHRFRGHLYGVWPHYPRGRKPYAEIIAYDTLWQPARVRQSTVGFPRRVLTWSPAPTAYWRLGDRDSPSIAHDETGNRRYAAHALGSRVATDGGLVADEGRATDLGDNQRCVVGTTAAGLSGTSYGMVCVFKSHALPSSGVDTIFDHGTPGVDWVAARINTSGQVVLSAVSGAVATSSLTITPGRWSAVGFRRSGTSWTLGVHDGLTFETYAGTSSSFSSTPTWPVFGGARLSPNFAADLNGAMAECVLWSSSDPGSSMLSTLTALAVTPGMGEAPVQRFASILAAAGIPDARRTAEYEGYYEAFRLGVWPDDAGGTMLDSLRTLARTATADIYATNQGIVRYRGYSFPTGTATPVASFSDADDADISCREITPVRHERGRRSKIVASDGNRAAILDDVSTTEVQTERRIDIFPADHSDKPYDVAARASREQAESRPRFESIDVQLLGLTDAERLAVLAIDLTDPVAVKLRGQQSTQRVVAIRETITPASYDVAIGTEPLRRPYVPAVRAIHSAHQGIAHNTLVDPDVPGEQYDNDGGHLSVYLPPAVPDGIPYWNNVWHRNLDTYLLFAQTWWAGNATSSRETLLVDPVAAAVHAKVSDQGDGQSNGQQVMTLRKAGNPGVGQPIETTQLQVRQFSGSGLDLFASLLGDANWGFAPTIGQVRVPDGRHVVLAARTASLTYSHNTETTVHFTAADVIDTDGMHDPASNAERLTLQKAGSFLVGAQLGFASNSSGHRIASILRNGGNRVARAGTRAAGGGETNLCTVTLWKGSASDFLYAQGYQSSGGNLGAVTTAHYGMRLWAVELAYSARATMTSAPSAGSISSGNLTDLTWTSERWDDDGIFTPSSKYMVCPEDGVAVIGAAVEWLSNSSGTRRIEIVLNDSIVIARRQMLPFATTSTSQDVWTVWPNAKAGDTFKVRVFQDSGDNNLTLFKTSDEHSPEFWFGMLAAA